MRNYLTEFIGTFFLVLTVGLTVVNEVSMAPLAIGCSLMVMVYMGGHVSGAHYNPAVSLAVLLNGKMSSVSEFFGYVASQLAGAIVAALVVYGVLGKSFVPAPAEQTSVTAALLIELLYTFALALVVLNSAASAKTHGNSFYGLAIGFTIVVAAFAGGPISGGAFNPAVGLGPAVVHAALGAGTVGHVWLYLIGPLAGGALAAVVFGLQEREPLQLHAEPSKRPESRPA
jgi:aquaporin Z